MGIWFESSNIFNELNLLLEDSNEDDMTLDADDGPDNNDSSEADDNSNDSNTDDGEKSDDQQNDENNEENSKDTTDDNSNTDENTGEDDNMSLDPDEDSGNEDSDNASDEEGSDANMEDDSMDNNEEVNENDPNARLKALEKSIFDQLSKEQKTLKTKELKSLYDVVYNKCTDIINTISGANRSPEQAKIYDYVMNSLTDLQKYIKDYLMQIFDSKTYIENMVQLQKYLTVLDTVSNIFDEVKKSSDMQNATN